MALGYEFFECHFQIACDVTNPLCGENGAVYVFGPQKGVKREERELMDAQMEHYASKTSEFKGVDLSEAAGAGAAGGLGFAFLNYVFSDCKRNHNSGRSHGA